MSVDYRALFEAAPDRYLILDPAFTIVAVTDAYLHVTMTTRDIVGRPLFEVFPDNPGDPAADGVRNLRASLERVVETLKPDAMALQKYDIKRPDGGGFEVRYWRPTNTPVLAPDGSLAYIIHRADDVTRSLRVEGDLRDMSRFLEAVIENLPLMIFVKEAADLTFVRFNRAGERLLGVARDALIGKSDRDFFPPSEANFFIAKDRETLASGAVVDIAEEPIQTARGTRLLHTLKVPILDDAGQPAFLLGISEDITERRAVERSLEKAVDAAEAANKELEAFSYSVAHDLRAPLRSIDGFSQALLEDCNEQLDADGKKYLRFVRESSQLMAQLIDDMLMLSRVSRTELARQKADLSALARAAVERLRKQWPGHTPEVVIADGLTAHGDPRLLAVIFDNLLGNAWKFTSKQPRARIELGEERGPHGRAFVVSDNGAGFDMKYAAKLFGVFQRLHAAAEFEGTGVGLATVQRIVRRHGGRIWAEGEVGKGAKFHFTLEEGGG